MNHREVARVLSSIEEKIDVNSFWVDGVQIWPLLRRDIWMYLLEQDSIPKSNLQSSGSRIYESENEYLDGRYRFRDDKKIYFHRKLKKELSVSLERKDILLWSRKEDHTEIFDNGVIDRIIDPMLWFVRDQGFTTIKLSRRSGVSWEGINQMETSIKLPIDLLHEHYADKETWGSVQKLITEISKFLPKLPITQSHIISLVRRLNSRSDYFDIVLDIVRPKLVILGVFYSPDALALIHACRQRKIPTVDVQHGKQGLYHAMYSGWSVLPVKGYSVLPDYFWTWGHESSRQIELNRPRLVLRPVPVTGGNRWLSIWKKASQPLALTDETKELIEKTDSYDCSILISLQPLRKALPDVLIETMLRSPKTWLWLIRVHPHQRGQIGVVEDELYSAGIKSFEIRHSSNVPLYPLLKKIDIHITRWSSIAYESLALGKATILVDPFALSLYGDYINRGLFNYTDKTDELLEMLKQLPEQSLQQLTVPYIETDDAIAKRALSKCIKSKYKIHHFYEIFSLINRRLSTEARM